MNLKTIFAASLVVLSTSISHAGFVGVYEYLSTHTKPFAPQTGSEPWTFRVGDQNGSLMGVYSDDTYGIPGQYAQFGGAAAAGALVPGTAGTNEAAGIFTHTASSGLTSAVFQADSPFLARSFVVTSELVGNGNLGNGIDLTLRTITGGTIVDRGTITILNTQSAQTVFDFGVTGLQFNSGDKVVALFSARDSYFYDHGWWDIALHEVNQGGSNVTDTSASALLLAGGLLALGTLRRRNGSTA